MHGQHVDHGDIARRQGLGGLVSGVLGGPSTTSITAGSAVQNGGGDPLGIGSIVGGVTSAILPPLSSASLSSQSSSSSTTTSSASSSSLSSSSSSVSSSSSSTSSTVSSTVSSTSSTPSSTITTPSSTSAVVVTSTSKGAVVTATAFVPASASSPSNSATVIPKAFLQNKPLETGVFVVVGIVAFVILILIGTIWIRSANRRKLDREALAPSAFNPGTNIDRYRDEEGGNSLEKLRRVDTTSSSGHTHTTAGQAGYGANYGQPGYGQVGYPVPPMPSRSPMPSQGYGQPAPYNGQLPQGQVYNNDYHAYTVPRSPTRVYDPARAPGPPALPQLNIIAATPSAGSPFDNNNPNRNAQRGSMSLLNSSPTSPSPTGDAGGNFGRSPSSQSRSNNGRQEMPVAPPLPAKFGSDEGEDEGAYSGIDSGNITHEQPRALKIANQ